MSAAEEHSEPEQGRLRSWSVRLAGGKPLSQKLPGGRTLLMSATWRVDRPGDKLLISAPVSIGCESRTPTDVWELLRPLLHVQDLLGFAFDGFVAAEGGRARPHLRQAEADDRRRSPTFWNGALMVRHPAARAASTMAEVPLFDLPTIEGLGGLGRWISLSDKHPRATGPVVFPSRYGPPSAYVAIMEIAAAIEYWVKASRPAAWASGKRFAQAVASRCSAFGEWVGDPDTWARAFWRQYNLLKHEPTYILDPVDLGDLAESARYLLAAVLLDRAARTKAPSRAIFKHRRLRGLGERLRDRYSR